MLQKKSTSFNMAVEILFLFLMEMPYLPPAQWATQVVKLDGHVTEI